MKVFAYLRVSTDKQELGNQKLEILNYANKSDIKIDEFVEIQVSSRKSIKERGVSELFEQLDEGDLLIVSELSRLGRSLGQIISLMDQLVSKKIRFVAIKENIKLDGKQTIQSKVMISLFGLFAEIERDLISERTRAGLAAAKAAGKKLGRRKGSLGKSKLDGMEEDIKSLLSKTVSKSSIAKILGVSRTALHSFISSRGLV